MATILVVDDEASVRLIVCMALGDQHRVVEACNGLDGLEKFKKYNPELIITDLVMPALSGIDMVRKLRVLSEEVKIIALSTFHKHEEGEILNAGADLCLSKPVGLNTLEEAIDNLLVREQGPENNK
jgi:two-component system, OmpR family, response regulator VanR